MVRSILFAAAVFIAFLTHKPENYLAFNTISFNTMTLKR